MRIEDRRVRLRTIMFRELKTKDHVSENMVWPMIFFCVWVIL